MTVGFFVVVVVFIFFPVVVFGFFFCFSPPNNRRLVQRARACWEHLHEWLCSGQEKSPNTLYTTRIVSCNNYCKYTNIKNKTKTPTLLELTHRWTNLLLFSWSFAMCLQVSTALFKFKQGPFCTNFAGFHLWVVHLILHSRWWCVGVLLYICNRFLILQN